MTKLTILGHRGQGGTNWGKEVEGGFLKPRSNLDNQILPENSISAMSYALAHGADGFECDVYLSADGVPMVIHDNQIARNADGFHYWGKDNKENCLGHVSDFTAAELKVKFSIGNGECIPTLEDMIQLAIKFNAAHLEKTGKNLTINVEIKGGPKAAKKVYELMQRYLYPASPFQKSDFLFNSFDRASVLCMLELDPTLKVAQGIRTNDLYREVKMPGWLPTEDHYSEQSQVFLNELVNLCLIPGLDLVTSDIDETLVEFCIQHHLFLNAATSAFRLKTEALEKDWIDKYWPDDDREKKEVRKLLDMANKYDLDIYYKADNPGAMLAYLKKLSHVRSITSREQTITEKFLQQTDYDPRLLHRLRRDLSDYAKQYENDDLGRDLANAYRNAIKKSI